MNQQELDREHFYDEKWYKKKISLYQEESKNHKDKYVRDKWFMWVWNALT